MKLERYLTETSKKKYEEVLDTLARDCAPFLKETDKIYYRGMGGVSYELIQKFHARKDRKPKDMPLAYHNELDKIFQKYFGWKARTEGVFASGRRTMVSQYGSVFIFMPIGKFRYVFSPDIRDLYMHLNDMSPETAKLYDFDFNDNKLSREDKIGLDELVRTNYEDKGLKGLDDGIEVMFDCPNGYYLVDDAMVNLIKRRFRL